MKSSWFIGSYKRYKKSFKISPRGSWDDGHKNLNLSKTIENNKKDKYNRKIHVFSITKRKRMHKFQIYSQVDKKLEMPGSYFSCFAH